MTPRKTIPKAPRGLSERSRRVWRAVNEDYELSGHELAILEEACRSLDRADEARATLDREGMLTTDRYDRPKAHPAVAIEKDSRMLFIRCIRELGLDPGSLDARPPRIAGRYDE